MSISLRDNSAPTTMVFGQPEAFRIEPGGKLIAGPGLSDDEATRRLFAVMVEVFPDLMRGLAKGLT